MNSGRRSFPLIEESTFIELRTIMMRGFPWWLSGEGSACHGKRRGMESLTPGPRRPHTPRSKQAHTPQLLSPCPEPGSHGCSSLLLLVLKRSSCVPQSPPRNKRATATSSPGTTTREGPRLARRESASSREDPARPKVKTHSFKKMIRKRNPKDDGGKHPVLQEVLVSVLKC